MVSSSFSLCRQMLLLGKIQTEWSKRIIIIIIIIIIIMIIMIMQRRECC